MKTDSWLNLAKPVVFIAALVPLTLLVYNVLTGIRAPTLRRTSTLRRHLDVPFPPCTLTITPIRRLTGWNRSFSSAACWGCSRSSTPRCISLVIWRSIGSSPLARCSAILRNDRLLRPAWRRMRLMVPLALTSTKGWIRRLGRRWQILHRLIYLSGAAAALHFVWKVKVAIGEPVYYAVVLAVSSWISPHLAVPPGVSSAVPAARSPPIGPV